VILFQCDKTVIFHALKRQVQKMFWFLCKGHDVQRA